jgi:hypothetical protein
LSLLLLCCLCFSHEIEAPQQQQQETLHAKAQSIKQVAEEGPPPSLTANHNLGQACR